MTTQLFHAGLDSQLDVQQARTQLETTRAQDQDVGIARAQDEHAIAILIGEPPASLTIPARVVQYTPPINSAGSAVATAGASSGYRHRRTTDGVSQ